MSAVKNLSIRLSAVGGDKVRQEFKSLGADGDRAFRRITQVIQPANDNLKALDATARSFNEVIRQGTALFGAYLGFRDSKILIPLFSAPTRPLKNFRHRLKRLPAQRKRHRRLLP